MLTTWACSAPSTSTWAGIPSPGRKQVAVYTRVLRAFRGKPVNIRMLDIGGDKKLDSIDLPAEDSFCVSEYYGCASGIPRYSSRICGPVCGLALKVIRG